MSDTREDIRKARMELDRWSMREREAVLREHRRELRQSRLALRVRCEALGGHEWQDLPNNGINHFSMTTGEWPRRCRWCDAEKPPAESPAHHEDVRR